MDSGLDIARSLATHGAAINAADYEVAWTYFTDREKRSLGSFATWARGVDSSIWVALTVNTVRLEADTASVGVLLRTRQDAGQGPQGQDCSDWDITYTMKRSEAAWLIDKASAPSGAKVCTT